MPNELPINASLGELLRVLRQRNSAVLIAPPGAGKTTAVAPALLAEPWCPGQILLLSPRRVAARSAAERMAETLGESVGGTVGYQTRFDSRVSDRTRILVLTEAIFLSRILADEELAGVSCVLFDEAHERHLDSDLGLALALESQSVLREDLRILVMSATIAGEGFADLLGGAPVIESEGRQFALVIKWLGSRAEQRLEDQVSAATLAAWREQEGDILVFLPGVREIERVQERLVQRLSDVPVLPLHGRVSPAEQRAAIRKDADGRRRIVLATSIAETSITLEGVRVVVDCGLSKRPVFDMAAGTTRLVTTRASQASATQRAGRAARTMPGIAYRLWEEAAHPGREPFDPPEILTGDLSPLVLALARWNIVDPSSLRLLDAPASSALAAARSQLRKIGAIDNEGRLTDRGNMVAALPMAPWQAAMLLFGAEHDEAGKAAKLALLLQERGLGGSTTDLGTRLEKWDADRSPKASASRKLAASWASRASSLLGARQKHRISGEDISPGVLLAAALPDNIAKRRDGSGENWLSAAGRGYRLDPLSPLARAEWLAIGDAQGSAQGARISAALTVDYAEIEEFLGERIDSFSRLSWNGKRIEARLERRLGAIILASGPDPDPDPDAVSSLLLEKAVDALPALLPATLIARARFAGIAHISYERLAEDAGIWLLPLLEGRRDFNLPSERFAQAVLALLDWDERQRLEKLAPRDFESPAGTRHAIDYSGDAGPAVELRVQVLYGLDRHPKVGDVPLVLSLTSPAGRLIQTTRDLPGFWRGSWAEVAKEMRGRYPKHRWPDEPWAEKPSLKTKRAFFQSSGT